MTDNRNKEFIRRHIGPSSDEQKKMLTYLGCNTLDEFIKKIVPEKILETKPLKIDSPISEHDALQQIKQWPIKIRFLKALLVWATTGLIHRMLF